MIDLNQYRRNVFQRAGMRECPHYSEDGVIREIFRQIGVGKNPLVIEFGESRSLGTTTRSFRLTYRSNAIYFTGNLGPKSWILNVLDISKVALTDRSISPLRFFRSMPFKFFCTHDNIVQLFRSRRVDGIDVLTIDIDSYDYYMAKVILEAGFAPRLLILEYNPSLPAGSSLAFPYSPGSARPANRRAYGASFDALHKLASSYGYKLVHVSGFCNLHYVRAEYAHLFATPAVEAEIPRTNAEVVVFAEKCCQKGFVPSWLNEKPLDPSDLAFFSEI